MIADNDFKLEISLRDVFAGLALAAILSNCNAHLNSDFCEALAADSYAIADAMLAERVK